MTLSYLALPSISHVLEEGHGFIPRNPSAIRLDQPDASMTMALVPTSLSPSPSSHLMKTIHFRDQDLESEEDEQFSVTVGFPDEPASDNFETGTLFKEERDTSSAGVPSGTQGQCSRNWLKHNLSLFVTAIRKLPVKVAEALLRKAVRH